MGVEEVAERTELPLGEGTQEVWSRMKRSLAEATPVRALPAEGNEEGAFEHLPPHRARNNNNNPPPRPRKEQHQQLLPDYSLNQELTNSTFDGSNTSWSSSDWNGPRAPKSEPSTFYKYQGSYQAGDWPSDPSYGVMHQSPPPSASSSSYYDASNDYYGYGYGYGQQPYGMQHQQQHSPYPPPAVRPPCDAPYNGSRIPAGKQMVPDYRRQNRFGVDAQGRIQHIKREPDDGLEQEGENFTSLFTKSLTSLYSQDAENAFPDEGKGYDPDIMILDTARPHAAMDEGAYARMNASYGMGAAGYPNHHQGPRHNFGGYYENRNQIPEQAPSGVQDLNAESERVNSFRYDRPSFDDMHLYASSPNDTKGQAKKRKASAPNASPEGGPESRRKGPRLASFKSDSKWTPNSFAFADVAIKQEPLDEYEDGESQSRCLPADHPPGSNGAPSQPADQPPKPAVRKRSPGTTCFDRFEKKSTPASKKVSPLSVYAKVQDSLVLSVKCRRYKKRTKPITAKEDATYPGREEIENWKRTGAYSQSPDQAVRLLMNELIERVSNLGDRSVPEGPELPPVDLNKARELLYQFCKRYSIDYSDFENAAELKPRMVATEPTKNFERASAIRKRTNISPVSSRTPTRAEVRAQKGEKVTRKAVAVTAKSKAEVAKSAVGKRALRQLPARRQSGRKLRGRSRKASPPPVVVTRRYSTRSAKEDGHSDVDIVIGSSSEDEKEAGKEAEVPKKSQRLKNKHPVVETPAKANNIERNNSRNCVKKEDVNIRSRSRKAETEKQDEVAKLAPLKKKWSRLHETECTLAESVASKKPQPVATPGKDAVKTESSNTIKTSDKQSNKMSPKISSRKSADKIICDSVLSSPTFNIFARQTRRKSFDVVEIDCDEKEVKPADDKCFVKLVKHSETKPCDKLLIKKEPVSPERRRGPSRESSSSKTRFKCCDTHIEPKKGSTSKQGSLKEAKSERQIKMHTNEEIGDAQNRDAKHRNASLDGESAKGQKKFQADIPIKDENSVEEMPCGQSCGESEKRQAVIPKLGGRSQKKDVPKASEKRLSNAGKPAECDRVLENSSPKKNEFSQIIDKTDSVVQIKLTKLPLNFSCESSSFSESSPEDSLKVVIKNRQSRSKSRRTHSRKGKARNEDSPDESLPVANFLKPKTEVIECESKCDKTESDVQSEKEDSQSNKTRIAGHKRTTSETAVNQPETSEVPQRRKRNRSKCADNNKANRSPKTEIPQLEPKIVAPDTKDGDTATPTFDLRTTILKIRSKIQDESSGEPKADKTDSMDDKSSSASEPPKLDCMKESHPETINSNSKENKSSDPGLGEASADSNPVVCERMPSIFPVSSVDESSKPQTISIHRRSDSDDSDCGGLVIDLDRRQSVEERAPSPPFEPKPLKEAEPAAVPREPTPSTSGYSSTSRDNNKWGLDDSDSDDECALLDRGRPLDITFSSLAREQARRIRDREESILRTLLLENSVAAPGTSSSQERTRSRAYSISPASRVRIRNNIMRIIMHQDNNEVSASSAAGGFDENKSDANSLPADVEQELEEDEGNPVDAKEKISKLKGEISYLLSLAAQKEKEKKAIVKFMGYKEGMLKRLLREYRYSVQDHVQDWMLERMLNRDPDVLLMSSGTQTSLLSFVTSLANDEELTRLFDQFLVWLENRPPADQQNTETSAQTDLSMTPEVVHLAYHAAESIATLGDSHSGEQLPAVATMVANATENYGVDMRTMRNGVPTILQRALSSARDDTAASSDIIHRASTSRSSPSTETPPSTTTGAHHRQSFRTYQRSPPLPALRPSRHDLQPVQEPKTPAAEAPSRSPPALQPELRQPVPKIFSPQPKPLEKQQPLDLIVNAPTAVKTEMVPIKKTENVVKITASSSQSSFHRSLETPAAEAKNLKPEPSSSNSENSYRKPGTQYPTYESHFETTAIKTEPTYRKTDAPAASGSGLPSTSVPGPSTSASGLLPRNLSPSDGNFTFENRFMAPSETVIRKSNFSVCKSESGSSSTTSSKPEGSYVKSESPFAKPGPSPKPLEAAPKNRRVTSSPKRRPPGPSYSAWSSGRTPEAPATLDLRTGNARSKESSAPKKEPSPINGHSSPSRQTFMTAPPPTMLQQSPQPSSSSSSHQSRSHSSSHHHEASSSKGSIERIYTCSTEGGVLAMRAVDPGGYPNGLAHPLLHIAASSLPDAARSGVMCLGCGVSDARFLCSGCRTHWYCSPRCQSLRWPEHSHECGRFFE